VPLPQHLPELPPLVGRHPLPMLRSPRRGLRILRRPALPLLAQLAPKLVAPTFAVDAVAIVLPGSCVLGGVRMWRPGVGHACADRGKRDPPGTPYDQELESTHP
jgi:hypothetical protein